MKGIWIRGTEKIPHNRPVTEFVVSPIRGGGKSSLLEHRAESYLKRGNTVVDLFGSRDGEGLAWCRHPSVVSGEKKLALIHSPHVTVSSSYDHLPVNQLKHRHLKEYDILVSASPLHNGLRDEYKNINYITDLIYERGVQGWSKLVVGIVREASSLYYSRIRVDSNQTSAKAYMIYLIREARHMGLALEMDTLKFTSIDLDIRILCDYTYFKGQGYLGFPDDLRFLYGFFKPAFVRDMHPSQFIILSRKGTIGVGWFPEVPWHKQERENLLKILDITVEPNEGMIEAENYGNYKTVGDKDHMRMVEAVAPKKLRALRGLDTEKKSYRGIAAELGHSPSTVTMHVAKHDSAVDQHGYCPVCRRAGGVLYQDKIKGGG